MNHDACHCFNYEAEVCPKSCYRAELTQDYLDLKAKGLIDFNTSWASFLGSKYCKRTNKSEEIETIDVRGEW